MTPIYYTLTFPDRATHYVDVRALIPTDGRPDVELMMAVWTPGSYLIREYQRHVEAVTATGDDGRSLDVRKSAKNRWVIRSDGAPAVAVAYRVYGREMSVRTNWIEAGFAFLNGAPTFLTLAASPPRPHDVTLVRPAEWTSVVTALPTLPGEADTWRAASFDVLVDSPLLLGTPSIHERRLDDVTIRLASEGDAGMFDGARAADDLVTTARAHRQFWGALPWQAYVVLNLLTDARGGLEHAGSAVLMSSRWATRTRKAYLGWLELASHELFHVWNGKRLRPLALGPFDYEREAHTPSLWVVEGITDYYGDLLLHRAGLSTPAEFLDSLSDKIETLQTTPGRGVTSLAAASFDTWIKFYRPDENTPNTTISYYVKGAVVALLLDAKIRCQTGGRRSLDDVMRAAFERYAGEHGYTEQEFRALVEQVAGLDLGAFWHTALDATGELDYGELLRTFGLRFAAPAAPPSPRAWLGAVTRNDAGRLVVSQVRRGTPAHQAGLNVDDEIVAMDGIRVRPDQFDARLEQYRAGEGAAVLVARRDRLQTVDVIFGAEPARQWRLEFDPTATPAQAASRAAWLGVQASGPSPS